MRRILCIWLPNWPIQRLVVANSELRRQRVVLYHNHAQRGQLVSACSPAAQLSGVRIGMPLSEAKSLVQRAGDKRFVAGCFYVYEHDPGADRRSLEQLALQCHQFSPLVGLEQADEPSCILLDVSGTAHLFGGDAGLQARVEQHFRSSTYTVQTAIAPTIGMAWGLARRSTKDEGQRTKVGSGDFFSSFALRSSSFFCPSPFELFKTLPIEALRLQPTTVETLHQLGINQIRQIMQLPRAGLQSRFGNEITQRLDQTAGIVDEVITALHPPADFLAEQFLDYPVSDRETIEVILSRLAAGLCAEMRSQQLGGLVWRCQLAGPEIEPIDLNIKLFQPTATLEHLMPLLRMQMENVFSGSPLFQRGVRGVPERRTKSKGQSGKEETKNRSRRSLSAFQVQEISVSVSNCVLLVERQRQLFDENPRLDRQAISHLINRLSSRLGAENVVGPRLQSGAEAETACSFEVLVGGSQSQSTTTLPPFSKEGRGGSLPRRGQPVRQTISPLQRPLVLHPQPIPLDAVALTGEVSKSGASPSRTPSIPAMFVRAGEQLRTLRRWGPERIETSWWCGSTIRRDYWRVEIDNGRWLWVYRNLDDHRWYLHGEF